MEHRFFIKNTEVEINLSLKWSNAIFDVGFKLIDNKLYAIHISLFWANITYMNNKHLPF
jgi:hypothetical protein